MRNKKLIVMMEISLCVALSIVLSHLRLWQMPNGGSVTLQMLPLFILAFRRGGKAGLAGGLVFGLLRMLLSPHVYHPVQGILDYPLAFTLIGLAGYLRHFPIVAMLGTSLLRFISHVVAGQVFFGHYAPEGMNPWWYSITYNGTHLVPEILLTLVVYILVRSRRELFETERRTDQMAK